MVRAVDVGAAPGFLLLLLGLPSDARPAQRLLLLFWGRRQGLGQGLGRGLGLPEQEFVEQRVDRLWTLQHHHVAAFIDELQEGQQQDLQAGQGWGHRFRMAKAGCPGTPKPIHTRPAVLGSLSCGLPFIPLLPLKGGGGG